MGILGELGTLLGNQQHQQDYQNFVQRYQQGAPAEGYSDQEVANRYQQIAPHLPIDQYQQAAQQSFGRLSPQEREQFGQMLQQRAQQQGINVPGMGQMNFGDPNALAQMTTQVHQQQPGLLGQLLSGAAGMAGMGGTTGGQSGAGGVGGMLGNPVARAALAGITSMAVSKLMGGMGNSGNSGGLGGLTGGPII